MKPKRPKWRPYGDAGRSPFVLQRGRYNRARWVLRKTGEQIGPIHSNIAPAVAWAIWVGIEQFNWAKGEGESA